MAIFTEVGPEAKDRLLSKAPSAKSVVYQNIVSNFKPDQAYRFEPDADETQRSIRVNLTRAAHKLGLRVVTVNDGDGVLAILRSEAKPKASKKSAAKSA